MVYDELWWILVKPRFAMMNYDELWWILMMVYDELWWILAKPRFAMMNYDELWWIWWWFMMNCDEFSLNPGLRNAKPSLLNSTSCCVTTFVFYLFRRFRWCCCGCYLIPCCHYCWCYCRDGGCKCWCWCWCRWSDSHNCLGFHVLLIFHTHTQRDSMYI